MKLKDKVAIISGVGNRFGKATAFLFAKEGAKLALISRKKDIIKDVAGTINQSGGTAIFLECNATNLKDVKETVKKIKEKFGRIDILFNNAGGYYTKRQTLENLDEKFWSEVIDNNIKTNFLFTKSVLPIMKKQKQGTIINVSASSKTIQNGNSAYATAKMGIIGLTKNLARECKKDNIRVNCVLPGVIRVAADKSKLDNYTSDLCRLGQSEDVAFGVLFFASSESSWVTGQTLVIDGGEELFLE